MTLEENHDGITESGNLRASTSGCAMSLFGGTRVERLILAVGATGTEATKISIFQDPDSLRVCFICAYGFAFLAHGLNTVVNPFCGQMRGATRQR